MTSIDRITHPKNLQKVVIVAIAAMLICLTTSAIAVTLAYQANARSSHIAVVEARHSSEQTQFLRDTFCGLVAPLANQSQLPTSQFGKAIASGSVEANKQLACTPIPISPTP